MKAAVIGLGVEGKKAVNSLLNHGWEVYATDLNINVDLDGLDLPKLSMNVLDDNQTVSIVGDKLTVDLGFTNSYAIEQCDAIAISPSMYGGAFAERLLMDGDLLSDVVTKHKEMFTIGITGTNGKTTTVHMLKSILESAGKKVLVGGNGGGGFSGYYDLMLEANDGDYDILLVEVCDMTLDFCKHCFDFDYIGLTNIGNDHMNVHKTIANYKDTLVRFFEGKTIFTAFNQDFNTDFKESAARHIFHISKLFRAVWMFIKSMMHPFMLEKRTILMRWLQFYPKGISMLSLLVLLAIMKSIGWIFWMLRSNIILKS